MAQSGNAIFAVTVAPLAEGHLVNVKGEVDWSSASLLAEALVQFVRGAVTVDLSEVTFIDSSGLNALVAAHKHIERRNAQLTVRGASGMVRRVFAVAGLDELLHLDGH